MRNDYDRPPTEAELIYIKEALNRERARRAARRDEREENETVSTLAIARAREECEHNG